MAQAGILQEDDHIELLDGEIIEMSPIGDRHVGCVLRSSTMFSARLAGQAIVSVQNPVRLSSGSEPEPDIALLRPRPDFYSTGIPGPEDVLLLIEVAETSLAYDRDVKLLFYAEASIPEVWIADLNAGRILVYREPRSTGYAQLTVVQRDGTLTPLAFPDLTVAAADILG